MQSINKSPTFAVSKSEKALFFLQHNKIMKKLAKKTTVYLSIMNTEIGRIPVLDNGQKVNRPTVFYYARRGDSSVFYIIRPKDAEALEAVGYTIQSILVPAGKMPVAYLYPSGTVLTTRSYY